MTQLALVIDLNTCVGCHACVTSCKEWNTSGEAGPLVDKNPYGAEPTGTFFNRVQSFEVGPIAVLRHDLLLGRRATIGVHISNRHDLHIVESR